MNKGISGISPLIPVLFTATIAVFLGLIVSLFSAGSFLSVAVLFTLLGFVSVYGTLVILGIQGNQKAIAIYLGLLIFLADASLRASGTEAGTLDMQSLAKLMMWGGGLLIAVFHFSKIKSALFRAKPLLLTAYALFAMLSSVWSSTPLYSFGAGVALLSVVAICALATEMLGREQLMKAIIVALVIFLTLSITRIAFFLLAGTGFGDVRYSGFAGSPNNLGRIGGLLILFMWLQHQMMRKVPWKGLVLYLLGIAALVLSQSRTAMGAAVLSIWASLSTRRRLALIAAGLLAAAIIVPLVEYDILSPERSAQAISRGGSVGEVTTLTGRTYIWAYGWHKFQQSPIYGHGYAATRGFMPKEYFTMYGWTTNTLHNTILQSLVTTGIIGTLFIVIIWLLQAMQFLRRKSSFRDSIFTLVIICGITEAGIVGAMPSVITVLWGLSLFWTEPTDSKMQGISDNNVLDENLRETRISAN